MSATEMQNVIKRMQDVTTGGPWYGRPVMELLNEVNPEHAFLKPEFMPFAIADLLAHMIYWKRYVRDVLLTGEGERDQDRSYTWHQYGEPVNDTWSLILTDFSQLQQSLLDYLDNHGVDLDINVPGRDLTYRKLLEGSIDHDIYHIGQVILLHKIIKSQQKEKLSHKQ